MTKANIVKEQIKSNLESINELAQQILSCDEKIPQIDIDIVLEQLRSIYNDFNTLNKINSFQHSFEKETQIHQKSNIVIEPEKK